jgi:site-specific DNA-methyltransferase (adenine-specific)
MNIKGHQVIEGDCLLELKQLAPGSADLAYLDPPFFTNREHHAITRDRSRRFSFRDIWKGLEDYADFIADRLIEVHRVQPF